MRKLTTFIFILYSISLYSQSFPESKYINIESAEFIASYSLKYKMDSTNLDKVYNQEMWLFIGKECSYFLSKNQYLDNQIWKAFKSWAEVQIWLDNKGPYTPRSIYQIYKNYPKGKLTFTQPGPDGAFKYEDKLDLFEWKLTKDTASIGGYKVQKASCNFGGRKWTAWFSPEIPFNDGPYKFHGLPGLIVKLYDSREHYVFELIGLEVAKPDQMIEIKDITYIETTKKQFFKAIDAINNNLASRVKQNGGNIDSQQHVARVAAAKNNHIELKRK